MTFVKRAQAIAQLPERYAVALRLRDAGVADTVITDSLGIEPEGLEAFFSLATAKLDRILGTAPTSHLELADD